MTIATPLRSVQTFEDFVALPENADKLFEFIAGEIVEMPTNLYTSGIAAQILFFLMLYIRGGGRPGHVSGADGGYAIGQERYAPDVSYIAAERAGDIRPDGATYHSTPPDLAVEVVSPSDKQKFVTVKVAHYLLAGVTVWVVYPDDQEVHVYAPGQTVQILTAQDTIQGGDVLPGFTLPVQDIFPPDAEFEG